MCTVSFRKSTYASEQRAQTTQDPQAGGTEILTAAEAWQARARPRRVPLPIRLRKDLR